jgi:hypothetical protein
MVRKLLVSLVGFVLLALLAPPATGLAQTNKWSRPFSISGIIQGAWYPSVTSEGGDSLHVIWTSSAEGQQDVLFYSHWDGLAWSRPIDVQFGGPRTALAADRFGQLHLLFSSGGNLTQITAPFSKAMTAQGWSAAFRFNAVGTAGVGDLAVDHQGVLHVVWTEANGDCPNCYSVYHRSSSDGGENWSKVATLSSNAVDRRHVQLSVAPDDTLYVSWDTLSTRKKNQSSGSTVSRNHGQTWAAANEFQSPKGAPVQSAIGADGKGNALLLYRLQNKEEIDYQVTTNQGVSWSDPQQVPVILASLKSSAFDKYALATDSAGILHLVVAGRVEGDPVIPHLYHLEWDGKSWSKPDIIYDGGDVPEYPSLVITNGNRLNVTWFTRSAGIDAGTPDDADEVWYSTLTTSAPETTPEPTLTPIAKATQTPVPPTVTPTATRTPFVSSAPETDSGTANPIGAQMVVFAGIIPVVVVIGLVLALRARNQSR